MASRRINPYAKAYSFGTDGSAALAGSLSSIRPLSIAPPRQKQAFAIRAPLWSVIVAVAAAACLFSFLLLGVRSQATEAAKRGNALRGTLAHAEEINGALEVKIAGANDPSRIHAIAQNRLGMTQPAPEQIVRLPREPSAHPGTGTNAAQQEGGGWFRSLLAFFGL